MLYFTSPGRLGGAYRHGVLGMGRKSRLLTMDRFVCVKVGGDRGQLQRRASWAGEVRVYVLDRL
jgi:hypothetical protein